ncbi:hypothetical protein V3G39_17870 (plasmid) [Dermatophilaceae bacterium Sec6.4]
MVERQILIGPINCEGGGRPHDLGCAKYMFAVAHRTPRGLSECAKLASAGAKLFEVDVRIHRSGVIVSHFLPVLRVPGWIENDGPNFRLYRMYLQDLSLLQTVVLVPAPYRIVLDLKEDLPWRRKQLNERLIPLVEPSRFLVSTHVIEDLKFFRERGFETWRTIRNTMELTAAISSEIKDTGVSIRHSLVTPDSLAKLREVTSTVVAWTVNDLDRARQLYSLDVDGVTTDLPEVMDMAQSASD